MDRLLILSFLLLSFVANAQEKILSISKETNQRTIQIKEGKRIRIKTLDGRKISGRLKFVDENTIMIRKHIIPLGVSLGYITVKPPNVLRAFKASKNWKFKISEVSNVE